MAFINEIIPEDVKTGFAFPVKTLSDGTRPTLWKWTIDKERDITLLTTDKEGGAYEGTNETRSFMLLSRGLQIPFIGECRIISKSTTAVEVEWQVRNVTGGQNGVIQTPEVQESITDALNAMGWLYSTTNVEKVSVTFSSKNA